MSAPIVHVSSPRLLLLVALLSQLPASTAAAQDRLGGHFGFALPLVTRAQGQSTTIGDDFVIAVPMGITVKRSDAFAFDLELAPVIHNDPRHIDLTVHPGVAWGVGHGYSVGSRVAFDIGSATWGFTPLFNKGLVEIGKSAVFFGELDVPIRFREDSRGNGYTSVGLTVVFGLGF